MLIVRVELWPHGDELRKEEIGKLVIANDGTGTAVFGNYDIELSEKERETEKGRVETYFRKHSVWVLVKRALDQLL